MTFTVQLSHHSLHVYRLALALVRFVHRNPIGHRELRDQAQRASVSVGLGIAEGAGLDGAAKRRHYSIARASCLEVAAAYELAEAIGEKVACAQIQTQALPIIRILSRLTRPH
ncbi:MAG: four helix bundle protein [Polyangiales bacterium]|nr:four helix bundle protein [Myxococcales bacterium]